MVAEEKVKITFEAVGAAGYERDINKAETALRRKAKTLVDHEKALRDEIRTLKQSEAALKEQGNALSNSSNALMKEVAALRQAEAQNRKKISALVQLLRANKENTAALKGQITALQQEVAATQRSAKAMAEETRAAKAATKAIKEKEAASKKAGSATKSLGGAFNGLKVAIAGLLGTLTAGALLKITDDYKILQGRIQNATQETGDYIGVSKELNRIANDTGTALEDNVEIFQRLTIGVKDLGKSNADILRLTETVDQLGVIGGSSGEALKAGLLQFGQAMGAGVVRAEEFNSVVENLPALAKAIADGLGVSVGQLRKMVLDGKVLSKDVFTALESQSEKIKKQFEAMPPSLQRGIVTLKNSFGQFLGKLDEVTGATSFFGRILDGLAKAFQALTKLVSDNSGSIRALGQLVQALTTDVGRLLQAFFNVTVDGLRPFFQEIKDGVTPISLLAQAMSGLGYVVDLVATKLEQNSIRSRAAFKELRVLAKLSGSNSKEEFFNTLKEFSETDEKTWKALEKSDRDFIERQKQRDSLVASALKGGKVGAGNTRISDQRGKPAPSTPIDKKKTKDKTANIEQKRISRILDASRTKLSLLDVESDFETANLGPFATQASVSTAKLNKLKAEAGILKATITEINAAQAKTEEGKEAKSRALEDFNLALKRNVVQTKDLSNETERYTTTLNQNIQEQQDLREIILSESDVERFKAQAEARRDVLDEEYKNRYISAKEYYDGVKELALEVDTLETELVKAQIANQKAKIAFIEETTKEEDKILEAKNELLKLEQKLLELAEKRRKDETEASKILQQRAKDFNLALTEGVARSLEDAITGVFTGNGVLNSIKQFASSLRQLFGQTFAQALVEPIRDVISQIVKPLSTAFANISQNGLGSLKDLFKGKAGGALGLGVLGAGIFGGFNVGQSRGPLAGGLTGGAGGALGGALLGSKIGAIGGPLGAILGGALGLGAGIFGGLFGGKSRKKAEKEQKKLERVQSRLSQILAGLDENNLNLNDLIPRAQAINKLKSGGGNAFRAKRAALEEVQRLIALRQKQISEAIQQLQEDNKGLEDSLALAQAEPFKRAALEKRQALDNLSRDTQKLLDQFRDSEDAKTEIIRNETLKRKAIEEDLKAAFEDTAQSLADLFKQRDEISNSDVFTRAKTRSQVKAEQIAGVDKQIAETLLALNEFGQFGLAAPNVAGVNSLLNAARIGQQNNNIQILVNGAQDPNLVSEEIRRAMSSFFRRQGMGEVA